jgi:hypothetical protein
MPQLAERKYWNTEGKVKKMLNNEDFTITCNVSELVLMVMLINARIDDIKATIKKDGDTDGYWAEELKLALAIKEKFLNA